MMDSNDALSIKVSKKNLVKEHVQNNLVYITSNFKTLSESILKLQTKNMSLAESLSIVDNAQTQLKSVQVGYFSTLCDDEYMEVKEELLDLIDLKETTRGCDIKDALNIVLHKAEVPIAKIVSVSTDGAPMLWYGKIRKQKAEDSLVEMLIADRFNCGQVAERKDFGVFRKRVATGQ
ncbi:hypothetical protein QTP88_013187 [Uroleucon formosanum]